jgi:adenine-specific DNA-methyltransferase
MVVTTPLTAPSRAYLASRDPAERRSLGQFLTPRALRERLIARIPFHAGDRVLDPGVGTGEFLRSVARTHPGCELVGWDVDAPILEVARQVVPSARLEHRCALGARPRASFDVVIGNPPYFQLRLDRDQHRRFAPVISGRPNVFALFFQVGLEALRPGGWLGYVVPPSMNTGAYFQALRDHIDDRAQVERLEVLDDPHLFDGAQTAVQLIVLRKRTGAGSTSPRPRQADHVFDVGAATGGSIRRTVFCADRGVLERHVRGRATLWQLGYRAVTGTVVWNANRQRLRTSPADDAVPLVWAHNIRDGGLVLDPERTDRPQYVTGTSPLRGPAVVVNRVVGAVGAGALRCAPVPADEKFLAENHVNVIIRRDEVAPAVAWDELIALLRQPAVNERIAALTGNTQLSATELTHLLPLDAPPPDGGGPVADAVPTTQVYPEEPRCP